VEHFGGAFPLWVAPVQAVVIPIADRHIDAARELAAELRAGGLRFVDVDASDNRMQNKIRLAQGQKVPYMLILGDREVEARTVAVRRRGAGKDEPQAILPWPELAARLGEEVRERHLG
jgi:threonyl-tRNA synthetase